jgi:hypothetical protein
MSTRASVPDWYGREPTAHVRVCGACGGDWTGVWIGETEFHVCARCALEVLPRLIADATWRPALDRRDVEIVVERVRAELWRAVALNAMRERERKPQ